MSMKNAVRSCGLHIAMAVLVPAGAFAAAPDQPDRGKGPYRVTQADIPQLRKAVAECEKGTPEAWTVPDSRDRTLQSIASQLMLYSIPGSMLQACVSLEQPDNCGSLRLLPDDLDNCLRFKNRVAVIRGIFRDNKPQDACEQYLERDTTDKSKKMTQEDRARICRKVTKVMTVPGQYGNFCEQMLTLGFAPATKKALQHCKDMTVFMEGQPKICDSDPMPVDWYGYCEVSAGLVAAWRLKQPEVCSNMPLCRAPLTGQAPRCETYRAAFNKGYCDAVGTWLSELEHPSAAKAGDAKVELRRKSEVEAHLSEDAELARRVAEKKAAQLKKNKPQFTKGAPMTNASSDLKEKMLRIEKGLPVEPTGKPKATPADDSSSPSGEKDANGQ